MIGFSGAVLAGCIVYSFFDHEPFLRNPWFGDILGSAAALVLSTLVLLVLNNEYGFSKISGNVWATIDQLSFLWLPAALLLWYLIAWYWNRSHGIQKPVLLKLLVKNVLFL